MSLLSTAVSHYRSTLCILALFLLAGVYSYRSMPVEAEPEVLVPFVSISVVLDGVSPQDGARLLARPIEQELRSLANLDEIQTTSRESVTYVLAEFDADSVTIDQALVDVRTAVDRAKAEMPEDIEEPVIDEISTSDFPTITLAFTSNGQVHERTIYQTAKFMQREIESLDGVLEARLAGHREEVVEAVINPARLENYNITSSDLINSVLGNHLLVPAGELDTGRGKFSIKVPGLIEVYQDVYDIPVKSTSEGVVTLGDVTDIRRTFKDPKSFTTVNGNPAILLQVDRRSGANQIEVAQAVRQLVSELEGRVPPGVQVTPQFDTSYFSQSMVSEMSGNIATAMALVMVIVVAALGFRSGVLVGLGIPFSLLSSMIALNYLGYTFNFMVMFGMMLALGMLIDGSIVITEFADRKMAEGLSSRAAYQVAVKRMLWPVAASTATTLAAFLPLVFWPGVAGNFMGYLPVTVFWVLAASLCYALFFAPVAGSLMGRSEMNSDTQAHLKSLESGTPTSLPGITGWYARLLRFLLRRPVLFVLITLIALTQIFSLYGSYSKGVAFFAETEEKYGFVAVRAMGNLSVAETRKLVVEVERRVLQQHGVYATYARGSSGGGAFRGDTAKDEVGSILVELDDPPSIGYSTHKVFEYIRQATADMPGIIVEADAFEGGPPVGKPIQIQLSALDSDSLISSTRRLRGYIESNVDGLRDVTDTTPLPGIEWEMVVDRARAAQVGVNISEVGRAVQLVTNGVRIGDYRPDDADEEIEIRVRYPQGDRGLLELDSLRVMTPNGSVPISGFVRREAKPAVDVVRRIDGIEVATIKADVQPGILADAKVAEIQQLLKSYPLETGVEYEFRGANEEQQESAAFLSVAFSLALFLMFILLVTQFNSFYQGLLILSAVIMATAGVLLGLLLTGQVFSVILTGIGIVALAGIVVNNNIVLIDTYNYVRKNDRELTPTQAVISASAQRLRPVFLTTGTTILGLLPIAMGASIDIVNRSIVIDGVITSTFQPLASAIVSGLLFSTLLTLLVTPAMLVFPGRLIELYRIYLQPRLSPLLEHLPSTEEQGP